MAGRAQVRDSGPLTGRRVIEIAGRGPGPFAGMLLADMGAEVLRIDRPDPPPRPQATDHRLELYNRGRRSVIVDLKHEHGAEVYCASLSGPTPSTRDTAPG